MFNTPSNDQDQSVREALKQVRINEVSDWKTWKKENTIQTAKMNVEVAKNNAKHPQAPSDAQKIVKEAELIYAETLKFLDGKMEKAELSGPTKKFLFMQMPEWGTYGT